jgi:integrase
LRAALKQVLRWRLIPSNPASLVTPPRVEHREMAAMDPDQTRRFLNPARGTPLEALWVLAITTGLRQGELLARSRPSRGDDTPFMLIDACTLSTRRLTLST